MEKVLGPDFLLMKHMFSAEKIKTEEGYKRVLKKLVEDLKVNMDPVAVLDGLIKYEIGRPNNHMDIRVSERQAKLW